MQIDWRHDGDSFHRALLGSTGSHETTPTKSSPPTKERQTANDHHKARQARYRKHPGPSRRPALTTTRPSPQHPMPPRRWQPCQVNR